MTPPRSHSTPADIDQLEVGVVEGGSISNVGPHGRHAVNGRLLFRRHVGRGPQERNAYGDASRRERRPSRPLQPAERRSRRSKSPMWAVRTIAFISGRSRARPSTPSRPVTGLVPADIGQRQRSALLPSSIRVPLTPLSRARPTDRAPRHRRTWSPTDDPAQLGLLRRRSAGRPARSNEVTWTTGPLNYVRIFTPTLPTEVGDVPETHRRRRDGVSESPPSTPRLRPTTS